VALSLANNSFRVTVSVQDGARTIPPERTMLAPPAAGLLAKTLPASMVTAARTERINLKSILVVEEEAFGTGFY
jgi:hypothetical protein